MINWIKKLITLSLISFSKCNIIKNVSVNFEIFTPCYLLKNEECKVRKKIIDYDYLMIYPYKISVNRCSGSCNE